MSGPAGTLADPFDAGPYARLQAALGLTRPGAPCVGRRAIIAAGIAWLPLAVLAIVEGLAWRSDPRESLLLDVAAYARYVIAIPLLVGAEAVCLPKLATIAHHFGAAGLVADSDRPRYEALLVSARQLLASRPAELLILLLAYAATLALGRLWYPATVSTWIAPITAGVREVSLAGWWRALVSQPLFVVLMTMWLWRLVVWASFLWRVSRLELRLIAAHPDLAGGLYFVAASLRAFPLVALAFSVPLAGGVAEMLLYGPSPAIAVQYLVGAELLVTLAVFAGPLLVFAGPLMRLRARGVLEYGQLAGAVGHRFEERWLGARGAIDQRALEAPDFSATTDLFSVVANVRAMRLAPLDVRSLVPLVAAALLPFVPVLLLVMPVDEVLRNLTKLLI